MGNDIIFKFCNNNFFFKLPKLASYRTSPPFLGLTLSLFFSLFFFLWRIFVRIFHPLCLFFSDFDGCVPEEFSSIRDFCQILCFTIYFFAYILCLLLIIFIMWTKSASKWSKFLLYINIFSLMLIFFFKKKENNFIQVQMLLFRGKVYSPTF